MVGFEPYGSMAIREKQLLLLVVGVKVDRVNTFGWTWLFIVDVQNRFRRACGCKYYIVVHNRCYDGVVLVEFGMSTRKHADESDLYLC